MIRETGDQRLNHALYRPDLAPMDFLVFPEINAHLRGHRFESASELKVETRCIISTFDVQ